MAPAAHATQAPALHTIPLVPQRVPLATIPVSEQTREPVLQEPETVWHATCVHEFGLQVTQDPPLHTIPPDPQDVPLATIPVSLQTNAPVLQEPETVWHAVAVHEVGLQPVQTPLLLHTMLVPQGVATGLFPVSMQTAAPVVQEFVPVLHRFAGVQVPVEQATQLPALQTLLVPPELQSAPFARLVPLSTHTWVPVEQL
jgi:hypothetical protein